MLPLSLRTRPLVSRHTFLASYATALATAANAYYRDVRVAEGDTFNPAALALAIRAKETLADTLTLLGISSPERM